MDRAMREAYGLTKSSFEQSWRARTMRRYGALAILANLTALTELLGVVLIPLYAARRRRDRRRLDAMRAAEEAVERAARRSAIEALLATAGPDRAPPPDDEPPPSTNGP
jgi:type II secretory pathway component PulM